MIQSVIQTDWMSSNALKGNKKSVQSSKVNKEANVQENVMAKEKKKSMTERDYQLTIKQ